MWVRILAVLLLCARIDGAWAQSAPVGSAGDYAIGVSDVLSVNIRNLGQTEYDLNIRVPQNGLISIPLIGEIPVVGYSVQQVESLLERKLGDGYLRQPEVTLSVAEYRPFYIDGAVEAPGSYPFQHGLTVEKAIVLAGGLADSADQSDIRISQTGESGEGMVVGMSHPISAGDVITVGELGADGGERSIYLYGAVNEAGVVAYRQGLTVEKAIILAGGFSPRASKRKITIRRTKGDEIEEIKRAELSAELQAGDIITVGESFF